MSRGTGAARRGRIRLEVDPPAPQGALADAVSLLSARARAESELQRLLARRHDPGDVEAAVGRLRRLGYVDDKAWARRYVESHRGRNRGGGLLRRELIGRGVDADVVEEVLAGRDEFAAACRAARPRLRVSGGIDGTRLNRRLSAFLVRRGFATEVVAQTVRELLGKEITARAEDVGGGLPVDQI